MVLQDAARRALGSTCHLSPLMRLPHRAPQAQLPSDHSLFSEAGARPPTASTNADLLPSTSQSQMHSGGQGDSRGIATSDVASTSHAGPSAADGEGHSTDNATPGSRDTGGSNSVAADTAMGHGSAGSVHHNEATASVGSAAVGAQSAGEIGAAEGALPQERHMTPWQQLVRDPFALLMDMLALTQSPQESAGPERGTSVSATAADRVTAFQASG